MEEECRHCEGLGVRYTIKGRERWCPYCFGEGKIQLKPTKEDDIKMWRPIETAPKNGQFILTYSHEDRDDENRGVWINWWMHNEWFEVKNPTHWMPMPEPPTEGNEDMRPACNEKTQKTMRKPCFEGSFTERQLLALDFDEYECLESKLYAGSLRVYDCAHLASGHSWETCGFGALNRFFEVWKSLSELKVCDKCGGIGRIKDEQTD